MPLLTWTERGLYCPRGDFYIDPIKKVAQAVITHAHSDHARRGSKSYLCSRAGAGLLRHRLGQEISLQTLPYGESLKVGEVALSLYPAGHVLGSSQVRIEHRGEVWVVSSDYKRQTDPTCAAFEQLRCHTFITESTFGLPVYRWPDPSHVLEEIHRWWSANRNQGLTSVLQVYSLGKAQRLLAQLNPSHGPIAVHPNIMALLPAYRAEGVAFPPLISLADADVIRVRGQGMVLAPPGIKSGILDSLKPLALGSASGWMHGAADQRGQPMGFVLSDHADWPGLLRTVHETGAEAIGVMHGFVAPLVRYLTEQGVNAWPVDARAG